jgi:hypothetical protein
VLGNINPDSNLHPELIEILDKIFHWVSNPEVATKTKALLNQLGSPVTLQRTYIIELAPNG